MLKKQTTFYIFLRIAPLIWSLFLNWKPFDVIFYYWLEIVVITIFAFIHFFDKETPKNELRTPILRFCFGFLFYFVPHLWLVLFIGAPIWYIHPNELNGIIPNDIFFDVFKNALYPFLFMIVLYALEFLTNRYLKETTEKTDVNLNQRYLYFRITILTISLIPVFLLMKFMSVPVVVVIGIITTIRIVMEVLVIEKIEKIINANKPFIMVGYFFLLVMLAYSLFYIATLKPIILKNIFIGS
jgi:hypothetical protein